MINTISLEQNEVSKVADYLWDHVELIDEYLAQNRKNLSEEHRGIIDYSSPWLYNGWWDCL